MFELGFPVKIHQRKWRVGTDFETGKSSSEGRGLVRSIIRAALVYLVRLSGFDLRGTVV